MILVIPVGYNWYMLATEKSEELYRCTADHTHNAGAQMLELIFCLRPMYLEGGIISRTWHRKSCALIVYWLLVMDHGLWGCDVLVLNYSWTLLISSYRLVVEHFKLARASFTSAHIKPSTMSQFSLVAKAVFSPQCWRQLTEDNSTYGSLWVTWVFLEWHQSSWAPIAE